MNATAPDPVAPQQLRPQHVPALAKLAELGPGYWVEAGTTYGFHFTTLKAMERLGYVKIGTKVQNGLHTARVTYKVAHYTEAGAAAYAAHVAWVQAERDDRNEHDNAQEAAPVTAPAEPKTVPYVPGNTGWAVGTAKTADAQWLTVWGAAYDTRLLFADRAAAQVRADALGAKAPRGDAAQVRYVRVVDYPGVTLTGIAFRIIPEPPAAGAAYREALRADAPTGDPCPACHELHDTAGAEVECIADADA